MITDTKKDVYNRIIPHLPYCQYQVWNILQQHPEGLTNSELSYYLHWSINRVTPRINELRKLGYVCYYTTRQCKVTGSQARVWVAKEDSPQERWF